MLEFPVSQMMINFNFALFSLMQLDGKKQYIYRILFFTRSVAKWKLPNMLCR